MPFKKGTSGNSNGRPKGAKNKSSEDTKRIIAEIVNDNLLQVQKDLDSMSPKDRANIILKLIDKVVPSLRAVDANVKTEGNLSVGFKISYSEGEEDEENSTEE